jgi:hypothetical protein
MSPRPKTKQSFQQMVTVPVTSPAAVVAKSTSTAAIPPAKPAQHLYFVNGFVDYAMIGMGSTLACLAAFLISQAGNESTVLAWSIALSSWLMWAVNHPHFMATSYRLYHSKENIRQYPITALIIPWVIVAGVVGSFISKDFVAPLFVKVFLIWSPYHFSGQTLGITLIYARRAGFFVGKWERFSLSNFIFGTFLVNTARGESAVDAASLPTQSYYDIEQMRLGLPGWVADAVFAWMAVNGIVFLFLVARWSRQQGRMVPLIVLLPAVTQFIWFIIGPKVVAFYYFVPFFHSLQYLLIAWSMQLKEKMDQRQIAPSVHYVMNESLRWGAITFVTGALLFFGVPAVLYSLLHEQYGLAYSYNFVYGIIVASIQIHHFFVDGVIWKLKRKTVSSPLMVNIDDLIHPSASVKAA